MAKKTVVTTSANPVTRGTSVKLTTASVALPRNISGQNRKGNGNPWK